MPDYQSLIAEGDEADAFIRANNPDASPPDPDNPPPNPDATPPAVDPNLTGSEVQPPQPPVVDEGKIWRDRYIAREHAHNGQLGEMQQRIVQMQRELQEHKRAPAPPPTADNQFSHPGKPIPYPDDDGLDEDTSPVIRELFGKVLSPLLSRIDQLEQKIGTVDTLETKFQDREVRTAEQNRQGLFSRLDRRIPGWRDQDVDPDFLAWLNRPDAMTGVVKLQVVRQAVADLDEERLVLIYQAYRDQLPKQQERPSLADFAAPGGSSSTGNPSVSGDPASMSLQTWNVLYDKLYKDYRDGKYAGRDTDFDQEDRRLLTLLNSGKVK